MKVTGRILGDKVIICLDCFIIHQRQGCVIDGVVQAVPEDLGQVQFDVVEIIRAGFFTFNSS